MRALYYDKKISDFKYISSVAPGSKIAAAYESSSSSNGAIVYYRNSTNATVISYQELNRGGQNVLSGSID